jgi:hypothetical protein
MVTYITKRLKESVAIAYTRKLRVLVECLPMSLLAPITNECGYRVEVVRKFFLAYPRSFRRRIWHV